METRSNIIQFNPNANTIDINALRSSSVSLKAGLILPAASTYEEELAPEHSAEPIKSMDDIMKISRYLIMNDRYRDNMLFIVGINFGLRVSDLLELRFCHLINNNFTFKTTFPVFEKKTRNTRKHKKNRYITINTAVIEAVTLYLEHTPGITLDNYLFRSESINSGNKNIPLNRKSVDRILKGIADDLGLNMRVSTHTLRKTWAYHQMVMSNNDPRKLILLSKMMGHSSVTITLDYIGITEEEIEEAYKNLNLGSEKYNYLNSGFLETEQLIV